MHTAKEESCVNCLHSGVVFPRGPKHSFKTFKMKRPDNSNINDLAENDLTHFFLTQIPENQEVMLKQISQQFCFFQVYWNCKEHII